jgi:putative addiction module killer protein
MKERIFKIYQTETGKKPYDEWFKKLDKTQRSKVLFRLEKVANGNYGHYKGLSGGLIELKFKEGTRIYFAEIDNIIILLLLGGGKSRQSDDIKKAQEYLQDYKLRSDKNE